MLMGEKMPFAKVTSKGQIKVSRAGFVFTFKTLLTNNELVVEDEELVNKALDRFATSNADFDDCLIEGRAHAVGCTATFTLDRNAAKSAGMTLL